jgi:hypothetical protein
MNTYCLVLIMTTDYELYLNFIFLTTHFFRLLLNNQQTYCVFCKVSHFKVHSIQETNVATYNTVASLFYFIHQCFDGVTLLTTIHL